MITLEDILKYIALKQKIKNFLIDKCIEFEQAAEGDDVETFFNDDYRDFYLKSDIITVYFAHDRDSYTKHLPLDILFGTDFKDEIVKYYEGEREKQRLALLGQSKQREAELTKVEEAKRQEKIEMLKGLMKEFPDIVQEGITND